MKTDYAALASPFLYVQDKIYGFASFFVIWDNKRFWLRLFLNKTFINQD